MSEGDAGRVMTDEERARALREQLKSLHAFDLAYEMMVSLVSFGYQKLGLTGETAELRDLGDAHFAVELLGAILNVVEREHGAAETRDLRSTLAQMQLGYVQALELAGERPPEPPAEPVTVHEATPEEVEADLAANQAAEDEAAGEALGAADEPAAAKPAPRKPAVKKPARKPSARKKPKPKPDDAG